MRRTTLSLAALTLVGALAVPAPVDAQESPATTATEPATATTTPVPTTTTVVPTTPPIAAAPPVTTPPPTTAPPPTVVAPPEATTAAPKVRGVGDSVFRSAESRVLNRLQPEYRPRFRSVLGALVREMTPTALTMAGNDPAALVFGLGNPDIAEIDDDPGVRLHDDAAYLIRRTRHLPCTVWINVKENGVNGFYNQRWAQTARAFNDFLRAATVDGPSLGDLYSPNLHILDWNATAARHPGWVLSDGLHLNAVGQAGYAGKVDRFLNRVCPP
ncbi:MAG TPA: hypothetical protein PKA98_05420 [Acidimicrobiales bacterium]|nr:hypothetical protein [Acidimicrobiales bacterium]